MQFRESEMKVHSNKTYLSKVKYIKGSPISEADTAFALAMNAVYF